MITKIGANLYRRYNYSQNNSRAANIKYLTYPNDSVSFNGDKEKPTSKDTKLENIMLYADASAKNAFKDFWDYAKSFEYNSVTPMTVIGYSLDETLKYINDLDSDKIDFSKEKMPSFAVLLCELINDSLFSDKELREKIKPVIENYVNLSKSAIEEGKPDEFENKNDISFSDELIDYIWSFRDDDKKIVTSNSILFAIKGDDSNPKLVDFFDNLKKDINKKIIINNKPKEEQYPFSYYNEKAKNVLKNLALGTDMFVTYDKAKENVNPFMDTVRKNIEENSPNTKFIELNENVTDEFLVDTVKQAKKDKEHEYIIAVNPYSFIVKLLFFDENGIARTALSSELIKSIKEKPNNVKYLFYDTKDQYYSLGETGLYNDFQETSLPSLNSENMIKFFRENPNIMNKDVKIPFSKSAIDKAVAASYQIDGVFPDKTIDLMKKIASYNVDKKEITEPDVNDYIKEASNILKKSNDEDSVEVIYDTKKHLSQLKGKTSTKKEAEQIVKQIKSKKLGTKGLMIYSEDGTPGCGRRFTAKAIAGDAKIPYLEVNTMDFGTKDVDLFGTNLSPEQSMRKLFSMVKTEAETNPYKSAVLFIENFEYFSVGEYISNYHQKAMAQLLREMDKADEAGFNILVIGSVSDPDLVGEATMKSFMFVDQIEVSSPAYSKNEREDVLMYSIKDEHIKLPESLNERENIISYAADITIGFSYIYLQSLVEKTKSVMAEKGHKILNKGDITEAYLQLTTGRPAVENMQSHIKDIVTSHECGHATNLEVMNSLAKTHQKPWHVPQKVNFVTLDPRGIYGGAVYHGIDSNTERSFEYLFSDIVCSYGGNSAESAFYDIDGSYGITCDIQTARDKAKLMVNTMGMGAKTGKMAIYDLSEVSDNMKQRLEEDQRVILNNAKITSDLITEVYSDFNKEFTKKYSPLVGTGNCLVDGDDFRKALNNWKSKQSKAKQKELEECDKVILEIIEATKRGVAVQKSH